MFGPVGPVRITLGTVVLDSPDRSGRYIAKDMVGGWAYHIADRVGDTWARSQGGFPGGLDVQLRCAFLLAASQVPDSRHITILVETRQAHRVMVGLARKDVHVIAAIAGRPVSVTTKPDERSSFQVRAAAERAAALMLRDREEANQQERLLLKELPSYAPEAGGDTPALGEEVAVSSSVGWNWRSERGQAASRPIPEAKPLAGPHLVYRQPSAQSSGLAEWLTEFNKRVAAISKSDIEEDP